MSLLSILGAEVKALQKLTGPRDLFARTSSYGVGSSLGTSLVSQSNSLDLERMVSDPLHNGVVAACVNAIARALPDAPLLLEQRTPQGWKAVDDHPCLAVLRAPNPDHSDADVWGLTSGYKATRGQAFWLLLPNSSGEVGEIHVWNPDRVTTLGDEENFISGYRVQRESGTHFLADKRQIIHFRHLPDFNNPRLGWNPLRTGRAQIAGDNVAASYHTSILFNAGVVSLLVSLKEGAMSGQVTPEQFQTVLTNLRRAGRERAGGIEGINLPLEVHKLAYSPDEMNVDKLIEYYETRICSVMGVSQRVAGLGTDPTYNNLGEALNDFWERRIVPDRNADAATLNRQWLPLWGMDDGTWRFRFDYSDVPALQENRDALHARVRADWEKGLVDKQQARALLGYATDNDGEFARVFYGEKPKTQTDGELSGAQLAEVKMLIQQWDESQHPRDERGRFASGHLMHNNDVIAAHLGARDIIARNSGSSSGNSSGGGGVSGQGNAGTGNGVPSQSSTGIAHLHLLNLLQKNSNLDKNTSNAFSKSLHHVLDKVPPHLHPHIADTVDRIIAFDNLNDLRDFARSQWNMPQDDASRLLGAWNFTRRTLLIDGKGFDEEGNELSREELYAHELTHAIDMLPTQKGGPLKLLSDEAQWKSAHKEMFWSALSGYSRQVPREGFAELGRLFYSNYSKQNVMDVYGEILPECIDFWQKRNLIP